MPENAVSCSPAALGLIAAAAGFGALAAVRRVCSSWRRASLAPTVQTFPEQTLAALAAFNKFSEVPRTTVPTGTSASADAARALAWLPRKPSRECCDALSKVVVAAAIANRAAFLAALFAAPIMYSSRVDRVSLAQAALEAAACTGSDAAVVAVAKTAVAGPYGCNLGKVARVAVYANSSRVLEALAAFNLKDSRVIQRAEFDHAVAHGFSAVLHTLAVKFRAHHTLLSTPEHRRECVRVASARGHADVLAVLAVHYGFGPADAGDASALIAVAGKCGPVLEVLAAKYDVGTEFRKKEIVVCAKNFAEVQKVVGARTLLTARAVAAARQSTDGNIAQSVIDAARRGDAEYIAVCSASFSDALAYAVFQVAVESNQPLVLAAVAQRIVATSVHALICRTLRRIVFGAAVRGYAGVLAVLADCYVCGFADNRDRKKINASLRIAAANGHAAVLAVFADKYASTAADARASGHIHNEAFRMATARGHAAVLAVLADKYEFGPANARGPEEIEAIRVAIERKHAEALAVLADKYAS